MKAVIRVMLLQAKRHQRCQQPTWNKAVAEEETLTMSTRKRTSTQLRVFLVKFSRSVESNSL